jgi:hypothetical protein
MAAPRLRNFPPAPYLQVEALALLVDVPHLGQVRLPQHEQLLLLAGRELHDLQGRVGQGCWGFSQRTEKEVGFERALGRALRYAMCLTARMALLASG